jgi:hypothetical protein
VLNADFFFRFDGTGFSESFSWLWAKGKKNKKTLGLCHVYDRSTWGAGKPVAASRLLRDIDGNVGNYDEFEEFGPNADAFPFHVFGRSEDICSFKHGGSRSGI